MAKKVGCSDEDRGENEEKMVERVVRMRMKARLRDFDCRCVLVAM